MQTGIAINPDVPVGGFPSYRKNRRIKVRWPPIEAKDAAGQDKLSTNLAIGGLFFKQI